VALLWFVAFLNYLDRSVIFTMHDSLIQAVPMTEAQYGLLTTVFLWVYAALSPFAGFLADRLGRRRVIIGSLFVWSAVTWLTGHAQTVNQLLLARAAMGISEACYIPAGMAMVMDYHRGPTRSLANGIHVSGVFVGQGVSWIGGWLGQGHHWSFVFNLLGLIGIGYSTVLLAFLKDAPSVKAPDSSGSAPPLNFLAAVRDLFSRRSFFIALMYWGLMGLVGWGIAGWMPTYFKEQFHLDQATAGFSATAYLQIAALFGVVIGGLLTDRWSRRGEHRRITITAIGLCLAAPGVLLTASTTVQFLAIAGLVLYGFTRSLVDTNMMPILCLISDARYRATGYGIMNMFNCFVGGVTVYVGGWLRDAHVDVNRIFLASAAGLVLSAALLHAIKPVKPQYLTP
jgi:MFS family permease